MKWSDYGESSITLLAVHTGIEKAEPHTPVDCWDLYRCFHLMDCLNLSQKEEIWLLENASLAYPDWKPFLKNWKALRTFKKFQKVGRWSNRLQSLIEKCKLKGVQK